MSSRVVWLLFGLSAILAGGALTLWALTRSIEISSTPRAADAALVLGFLSYAAVGSLILSRRPGNAVGWLFLTAGLAAELALLAQEYAAYALRKAPGSLPGGAWAAWLADLLPVVVIGMGAFLLLVFPTGRLPSRRWRPVAWLAAVSLGAIALGMLFSPGDVSSVAGVKKPLQLDIAFLSAGEYAWWILLLAEALAVLSVIFRYRRCGPEERQQLRWFVAAAPIWIVSILVISSESGVLWSVLGGLGVASLPIAAGIAILRYRLYDLGLVVRRTLIYGVLTAGLAGLYFGIVIGLQAAFSGFTRGNDLAIAGSTLAVAALFRPARVRIQGIVDRRFYRRRYDAEQTLAAFSARLRDEVDLDTLGTDLGTVVHETMQPAHVSLWLRRPE